MFIKKSTMSMVVILVDVIILLAVTVLYGFTELHISRTICALIWGGCIFGGMILVDKIER